MLRDHPDIERAMATGYPGDEPEQPVCPVCGQECETIYRAQDSEIVGCDMCISEETAWECRECFREEPECEDW